MEIKLRETLRTVLNERSINAIRKAQDKNLDDIAKALEFYKKNKHTDKKEPFIKLLKKLGKEKEKLATELDMKVSGMYKNAEYKGESVNEGKKIYYQKDGIGKAKYTISYHDGKKKHKDGSDFFDIKIFKNKKDLAKFVNSLHKGGYVYGFGESVNEASIKESVNEMAMGFDSMTGLFYLKGVPFTKERIKEVILFMKSSKPKTSSNQFEMTSALIVKDKVNKGEVTIDSKNLKTLIEAFKRHKNLASDKDFN